MGNAIANCSNSLQDRFIAEDSNLRDGGLWPEYAHTMKICIDSFQDDLALGRLSNYYFKGKHDFKSLDQLLFALESVMAQAVYPQADTELRRTLSNTPKYKSEATLEQINQKPKKRTPFYKKSDLVVGRGKLANFYLRVYTRQHSSMQGVLLWHEGGKQAAFRSELELLLLLRATLSEAQLQK